jgi:hypothetical protein
MEPCQSCGAALSADAQWCGQCYAVRGGPATVTPATPAGFVSSSVMAPSRSAPAPAALKPQVTKTRWRKTPTTFGPFGRLVATFALVIPFVVFVVISIFTGGITIAGPVIWGFVLMPWGLRDTWRAGQITAPRTGL